MLLKRKTREQIESTIVFGAGPDKADLMLIGERPAIVEIQQETPFVGPAGRELDLYLSAVGMDRNEIYLTNTVKTFNDYAHPTPEEIDFWRPILIEEINSVQPRTIGLLGTYAVEAVMGAWWSSAVLNVRHGHPWRLPVSNIVVVPMYHPAYGLYDKDRKLDILWDFQQLEQAHHGEVRVEWIDTTGVDDGIRVFWEIESESVRREASNAARRSWKSTWGVEWDHRQSDTRAEMHENRKT
jgi:uracil-DNA glycosylase